MAWDCPRERADIEVDAGLAVFVHQPVLQDRIPVRGRLSGTQEPDDLKVWCMKFDVYGDLAVARPIVGYDGARKQGPG